jgi:opacity protein-like surface antigen
MKTLGITFLLAAATAANALAQQWEIGAVGGGSFWNTASVSSPTGSGNAGFKTGFVAGAYVGQNLYSRLSGQIRYEFFKTDLKISAGGTSGTFAGMAHAIHYDVLLHTRRNGESRSEFFMAFGGGMKIFQGTGTETPYQSTMLYGYMTRTREIKPMASVGGGLSYRLSPHMSLRAEVRDFITPFPGKVITAPSNSVKYGSILNDIVPMIGLDYVF